MTDSYLTLFVNSVYSKGDPQALFSLLFLALARLLPIIAFSPFFGARLLPNPVKVLMAMAFFVIFLPTFLLSLTTPILFNPLLILLVVKELFVGVIIGFMISMPFTIVQASGMMIDHQRGGASLMVNDPTIQNQSSPIGTLFNMVLIVVFFAVDGPFLFLDAIQLSYEVVPPDQFINRSFFAANSPFWTIQVKLFNEFMTIAVRLCTPALIAILMTDVFLGIANRLAPQVQITFLGLPLKSLLGLAVVCFGWPLLVTEFGRQSYHWVQVILDILRTFKFSTAAVSG